MIPSRGACLGVFILCFAAKLRPCRDVHEWVSAAREWPGLLAQALDLAHIAQALLRDQLAFRTTEITLSESVERVCSSTSRSGLIDIARQLLLADPPHWLNFVIRREGVFREYIPAADLDDLVWIDPDLDVLLGEVQEQGFGVVVEDGFLKRMGTSAEKLVLEALREAGKMPIHVAEISDAYGYDIECRQGEFDRIEVKAASESTQGTFHLSRNEFEKSKIYRPSWRLVQVVFANAAFVTTEITRVHILAVNQLNPNTLEELVPPDTSYFRWESSSRIYAPNDMWTAIDMQVSPTFAIPGFRS